MPPKVQISLLKNIHQEQIVLYFENNKLHLEKE